MWDQWYVLLLVIMIIAGLIFSKFKPSTIFALSAIITFMTGGTKIEDLTVNFTNPSLITLVLLILASCALEKTRLISTISRHISKGKFGYVIAKLGISTAFLSSFTNNTAVVVSLMGAIKRNQNHPASRLLIPLSYTAILGGTLTLIGTSTNLILNSFVIDAGLPSLGFFAPTQIGLIILLLCIIALIPLSYCLPNHETDEHSILPYFLEARIRAESPLIGKSIKENNLRDLRKLFLAEVIRDGLTIPSVTPDLILEENDRLLFCGDIESVNTLQEFSGLTFFGQHDLDGQEFVEVVISHSADLCNKTLKSIKFRDSFDAVVIAIRRGHERLEGGLGHITLQAGDTLVLAPGKHFAKKKQHCEREFVFINDANSSAKLSSFKSCIALLGFMLVIGSYLLELLPIIKGLAAYILIMLMLKIISLNELRRRFPVDIIVIVGAALSIAQLMLSTGLSENISRVFISTFHDSGPLTALIATYLLTLILTELITNNAAAALAFPIGLSLSIGYDVNAMPFIMAILFGASASFISPYSYQTNLLVYSLGNYQMKDFAKIGLPISFIYSIAAIILIPYFFPF